MRPSIENRQQLLIIPASAGVPGSSASIAAPIAAWSRRKNRRDLGIASYEDLLVSTFTPLRLPLTWPQFAADLDAAANGDASALETAARAMQTPEGLSGATTSAAISCGDGPARLPSSAWPRAVARFTDAGKLWGPVLAWWLWAPCASNWPAHATDPYTGPGTPRPRPRSDT
jgi:hypothetical protein